MWLGKGHSYSIISVRCSSPSLSFLVCEVGQSVNEEIQIKMRRIFAFVANKN